MDTFLIYGATGYTGQLISQHAVERGLRPILAARNAARVTRMANDLGLEYRVFSLDSPDAVQQGIGGVSTVLHAAGPFSATAQPMADACLRTGTHYIDITGEVAVIEALAKRDAEARDAGVVLLPGAGFDVVPSDCLAAHMKRRLPGATQLRLGIAGGSRVSRGTARTMVEGIGRGTLVRRGGRIIELARPPRAHIDFGNGLRPAIGASWGDVATAWHSTHIPDIAVFFKATRAATIGMSALSLVKPLIATHTVQRFLKRQIDKRMPPGPAPEQRAHGRSIIVAEAWDAAGAHVAAQLETVEAYTLTAWTAVEIAQRLGVGAVTPGYHTPATAFGADFILEFPGTTRTDR